MDDTHDEGEDLNTDVYEGDELDRLEIPARRVTVIRPSGSTIVEIGEEYTVTIDLYKPIGDGLPWTIDVFDGCKRTAEVTRIAERVAIDTTAPTMPDPGVIRTAIDLWRDWLREETARSRQRRKALRLLRWISGGSISTELQKLVLQDEVTVSCELSGSQVVYKMEICAGPTPGLPPSELFAD